MGLIFRFQYTAAPPIEAPQRCALLPGGLASVRLHINTYCERTTPPPLLLTGWDYTSLALCCVVFHFLSTMNEQCLQSGVIIRHKRHRFKQKRLNITQLSV